jgi:flagellar basal-body rod protein FlgG
VAYTRAGQFTLNSDGEMVLATDQGRRLDPPITIDGEVIDISIDSSGQVLVQRPGQSEPEQVGQLQLANFVNPTGLKPIGENLFVETGSSGPPIDGNPAEDSFGEMNSNTIRAADEALRTIGQLRR